MRKELSAQAVGRLRKYVNQEREHHGSGVERASIIRHRVCCEAEAAARIRDRL